MNIYWHDWVGYLGVALVLLAFLLLQAGKLRGNGLTYQLMNVAGAVAVVLSLAFGPGPTDWPVFMMQLAWIVIGVFGIVYSARARRNARAAGLKLPMW